MIGGDKVGVDSVQLADVFQKLEEVSKRITPQREKIIRIFADNPGTSFSAEEIRLRMQQGFGEIGLATIYRTLELLTDLEVLVRETVGDGRAHYHWPVDERHAWPTTVCVRCGNVDRIPEDSLRSIHSWAETVLKFHLADYEMTLYGVCRVCHMREERRRRSHESIS
jgi:Fur family ferric uptake transcriptional regulator